MCLNINVSPTEINTQKSIKSTAQLRVNDTSPYVKKNYSHQHLHIMEYLVFVSEFQYNTEQILTTIKQMFKVQAAAMLVRHTQ